VIQQEGLLDFMRQFINILEESRRSEDIDSRASLMEHWQLFEMEDGAQPVVVKRVAQLLAEDPFFVQQLRTAVDNQSEWLCHTAGLIFRFAAMAEAGDLQVATSVVELLREAVNVIVCPLERAEPQQRWYSWYSSGLYMEALVAWVGAERSGISADAAADVVRRVGRAVVHCYNAEGQPSDKCQFFLEMCDPAYARRAHGCVWPSEFEDPVFTTFYVDKQ
jgi:hypothetical protein